MKHYLLSCLLLSSIAFGQKNLNSETSVDYIIKAYNFQKESDYENAIDEYSKISINDTNYAVAQYEMGTCYQALEKYKEAQDIYSALITDEVKFDFQQDVYTNWGLSYRRSGDSLKALEIFNEGLKKYPMHFRLYYNRGLTYEALNKYQLALEDYKMAVHTNIYFAPAHVRLGVLAANEEHYTEATLSFMTYFLLNPTGDQALGVVGLLEQIADGSFNPESKGISLSESNPFESLNLLYMNRVALEKKYKTKFTLPTAYAKQLHFICANATYSADDMDFWNQMYLPIYQEIFKANKLDQLIMLSLVNVESDDVQKKLKSKISQITAFIDWKNTVYNNHLAFQYVDFIGSVEKYFIHYEEDYLNYFGKIDDNGNAQGDYYYYHKNGSPMLKARFEDNKRVGTYEFYSPTNSKVYKKMIFSADEKDRTEEIYYYSGELMERTIIRNEMVEDTVYSYYRNGAIKEKIAVKAGKRDGKDVAYYPNGKIKFTGMYTNGEPNGKFENFHRNGNLQSEYTYVNGLLEGKKVSFFADGTKETSYTVKADKYDGPFEEYHSNGKLSEKGTFKNGVSVGELTFYYSNGNLKTTVVLDDNGKENGLVTHYDLDGKKYHEIEYTSGDIKEIKFFDKSGKMTVVSEKKGKKLDYVFNYPDGKKYSVGKIIDGNHEGLWTYYDRYGNIEKTEKYLKDQIVDTVYSYYANGQLRKMFCYKDGVANGMYLQYSIFGDLIQEGYYKDDNLDREWYTYNLDGSLENENYYMNGELHGFQKTYSINGKVENISEYDSGLEVNHIYLDTNGNIIDRYGEFNGDVKLHDATNTYYSFEGSFLNGENNGPIGSYGPTKIPIYKGNYENNMRTGKWTWYHSDGKLSEEVNYVNGEVHGVNTEYFRNGKVENVSTFVDGVQQGDFKYYYDNGKVKLEGTLLDGERHGKVITYSPDGGIMQIRIYDDGVITHYSYLGADGKEVPYIPFKLEADSIVTYYKNGKVALRSKRVFGLLEGPYITYYENGQIMENETFKHEFNHGMTRQYYSDGKLKYEAEFEKGQLNGVEKYFYPNGKLQSEQEFVMDTKHGELKEYSMEGKLLTITTYYDGEVISIKKL